MKGLTLGAFQLHEKIGQGGMGAVWKAVHQNGTPVAIKFVSAELTVRRAYVEAFQREVFAVASLEHPGIVDVYDQGRVSSSIAAASDGALVDGSPFLVMELLSHGSVGDVSINRWSLLRRLLAELLDALAHAHARGLVHRDIKPGNIMLGASPDAPDPDAPLIRLTDFGIAHIGRRVKTMQLEVADPMTSGGVILGSMTGTPHYMAPEQIEARHLDLGPWTDLYAIGCLAYRLAAGQPPFWRQKIEVPEILRCHLFAEPPPLQTPVPVPDSFQGWVGELLAKDISSRYQRAADALADLLAMPSPPRDTVAMGRPGVGGLTQGVVGSPTGALDLAELDTGPGEATRVEPDERPPRVPMPSVPHDEPTLFTMSAVSTGTDGRVRNKRPLEPTSERWPTLPPSWLAPRRHRSQSMVGVGLGLFGVRSTPMVDRVDARNQLWRALAQVVEHRSVQSVVIEGVAGVGKSRLVAWLVQRAHEVGAAEVLRATHSALNGPADGIEPMLARHLGVFELSRLDARDRIRDLVEALGGVPLVALALDALLFPHDPVIAPGERTIRLRSRNERYVAIIDGLRLLGRQRPVVLWLDDVQWGSDALGLLQYLIAQGTDLPLLVLATVRSDLLDRDEVTELLAKLVTHDAVHTMEVGPLRQADQCTLIQELLNLEPVLAGRLARQTAGNPLFAVQVISDWVSSGLLLESPAGFAHADGSDAELPSDVHEGGAAAR